MLLAVYMESVSKLPQKHTTVSVLLDGSAIAVPCRAALRTLRVAQPLAAESATRKLESARAILVSLVLGVKTSPAQALQTATTMEPVVRESVSVSRVGLALPVRPLLVVGQPASPQSSAAITGSAKISTVFAMLATVVFIANMPIDEHSNLISELPTEFGSFFIPTAFH